MSQPKSIETRLRPLWGRSGTQSGVQSGPESAFRAIHPAKPSIRLRLIGTCPSSHARTIRISPGQRIAQISYTTTSPRQTQTCPPSGVTAGRDRRTCSRTAQTRSPTAQARRPQAQAAQALAFASAGLRKRKPPRRGPSQPQPPTPGPRRPHRQTPDTSAFGGDGSQRPITDRACEQAKCRPLSNDYQAAPQPNADVSLLPVAKPAETARVVCSCSVMVGRPGMYRSLANCGRHESTPIPLSPLTPPLGGYLPQTNRPSRTPTG